jgi:hypothetical protein
MSVAPRANGETRRCVPGKPIDAGKLGRRARRKIKNGAAELPHAVDGRCASARQFKAICSQLIADQGGPDNIGEVRRQLIARFAGAAVLAIQVEKEILEARPVQVEQYSTLISSLVRLATKLGMGRIPKNLTPDLRTYLEERAAADQGDCEDGEEIE